MEYKFQSLLELTTDSDGNESFRGPMSPMLAIKVFCEGTNMILHGACRVENNQAYDCTYDHIIVIQKYKNTDRIAMFVDMGDQCLPVALYFTNNNSITISPVYLSQTTEDSMNYHRANMERPKTKDNPIMILDADGFRELFKAAIASGKLDPVDKSKIITNG